MISSVKNRSPAEIGARIRESRNHIGATLADTAEKAGIHANTLSNIEHGRSRPTEATLENVAAALGQSLADLLGTTPANPPDDQSVVAFLQEFRSKTPQVFEDWSSLMWERYLALGVRMGVANETAAHFFVGQVKREFRSIQELLDLFDANQADDVLAILKREHSRLRESQRHAFPD